MKPHVAFSDFKSNGRSALHGRRLSFKLGVIATLAIAVAANIAVLGNLGVMFGRVVPGATHQHLLVPYFQPLQYKSEPSSQWGIFRPVYDRLADSLKGRAETALYVARGGTLKSSESANPMRFVYLNVSPSLTQVLGVHILAGRPLADSDAQAGAAPVMVITDQFARAHFGDAESALNRLLTLDGKTFRIVGVLPTALDFPSGDMAEGFTAQAWVPLPPEAPGAASGFMFAMHALVLPRTNMSASKLQAALTRAYQLALPDFAPGTRGFIQQMQLTPRVETLAQREYGSIIARLQLLELAAVLLLLLVFANLTGLATADALTRRHELATRAALGADSTRLYTERAHQLVTLGLIGWAFGVLLGWLGSHVLAAAVGQAGAPVALSLPVLSLTLAAVIVITLLLALGGIRRLRKQQALVADLKANEHSTGGRGMVRTLRVLIVLQLVFSVVLLVITANLQMNVFGLTHNHLGFTPEQRTFFRVSLPGSEGNQTQAQYLAYVKQARPFDQRLLDRLHTLAGIANASLISIAPFSGGSNTTTANTMPTKNPEAAKIINTQGVSKDIKQALGLQVLAGDPASIFSKSENAIFLDSSAVESFWPQIPPAEAVGRSLYINGKAWRIAAVVAPLRMAAYGSVGGTAFFSFAAHVSGGPQTFVVNSSLPSAVLRQELANTIHQLNPQAHLVRFHSADSLVAEAYAKRSQLGHVFGVVALVALLITAVGLFALLTFRTLTRRPEFAIRGALGATPGRLFASVFAEAVALWGIGCLGGLPVAYVLSAVLAEHLPALALPAVWIAIAVVIGLGVVALVAAFVPARRAAGVELARNLNP